VRVTVVQFAAVATSRSANLQNALHWLEKAAAEDPSPDLVVLPAFMDTVESTRRKGIPLETLAGPGVAAVGWLARELGVFVAAGIADPEGAGGGVLGFLLDRDGDVLLSRTSARRPMNTPTDVETLLGRLALMPDDLVLDKSSWRDVASTRPDAIICSGAFAAKDAPQKDRRASPAAHIAQLAAEFRASVIVADLVVEGRGGHSLMLDPDGAPLVRVKPGAEGMFSAVAGRPPPVAGVSDGGPRS
jgi:predicted amidohydrolase